MILGHLVELSVSHPVHAGVTDVRDHGLVADAQQSADGRAQSGELGTFHHRANEKSVDLLQLVAQDPACLLW